jgi:membrane protease YdiL (CAAX protease family)
MNDPTEMVLSGAILLALGVAVLCLIARSVASAGSKPLPPELPESAHDAEDPFQTPSAPISSEDSPVAPPDTVTIGKVPVWFFRPLDLVGAGLVFIVFAGLLLGSLGRDQKAPEITPGLLMVNIGFQFMLAGIVIVLATRRVGMVTWLGIRWRQWPWVLLIAPGTVLAMWALFLALQISGYMEWMESLGVETVQDTVKLLQTTNDPLILGLMTFAAVIAAPVCEEIVFRGYFYAILKRNAGIFPAAFCSALVFAAAHGSLTALLPLFILGLVLVLVYEKTGSIWAPIAVHFCFNGLTVAAQLTARAFNLEVPV